MAGENDVLTRNDDGDLAVRVVNSTETSTVTNPDDVYTRDSDGNLAVRVVGSGGSGGDQHNLGYFATHAALEEAYPTAEAGDWAIVGATDTVWIWDTDNSEWVDSDQKGQVTSVNNQTGAVTIGINDILPTQTGNSGRVLGTDGFVAGWVEPEIVQRDTMPQADENEVGNIYQFIGTTTASYTNGYFYKCVSDGGNPATYSWTRVDVQPTPNELPDQTGQSGKFLTTNGTDASWASVSEVPATTGATAGDVLTLDSSSNPVWQAPAGGLPDQTGNSGKFLTTDGSAASWGGAIPVPTNFTASTSDLGICLGSTAGGIGFVTTTGSGPTGTKGGFTIKKTNNNGYGCLLTIHDGFGTQNRYKFEKDLGFYCEPNTQSANTLGNSTYKWANVYTTKINNGADITIPTTGGTMAVINMPATAPELAVADWSSNTQTITVTGVTASNVVLVSPAPASAADYAAAGIICTAQATDSLTFSCQTTPTNNLTVNVVILG